MTDAWECASEFATDVTVQSSRMQAVSSSMFAFKSSTPQHGNRSDSKVVPGCALALQMFEKTPVRIRANIWHSRMRGCRVVLVGKSCNTQLDGAHQRAKRSARMRQRRTTLFYNLWRRQAGSFFDDQADDIVDVPRCEWCMRFHVFTVL